MAPSRFDRTTALSVSALVAVVVLIYAPRLHDAPIYLAHDEVFFANQANSIATTAHDLNGRFLPLYFQIFDKYWAQPILIYAQAAFLSILPLSETAIRLPTVFVGALNVVLLYLVMKKATGRQRPALIAAGLLALTPAHFFFARLGVDILYPLPFILAWLLGLAAFDAEERPLMLFLGTACLGIGLYAYIAALVMMPLYLLFTLIFLFLRKAQPRLYLVACAGFLIPLVPLVPWLLQHPAAYADQVHRYGLYDSQQAGFWRGLRGLFGYTSLTHRVGVYWSAFNPSMLFFSGDSSLVNATRKAGVFLFPVAVFLPIGINQIINRAPTRMNVMLLLGLASAPIGAALVGELFLPREMVLVPFAIAIATVGVECLLSARHKVWRAIAVALLALLPIQFGYFAYDYFTDYRVRSSTWFERNIRGALQEIIAREGEDGGPAVYLSTDINWIDAYWTFYQTAHRRTTPLPRPVYFRPAKLDVAAVPARALLLSDAGDQTMTGLVSSGQLRQVAVVTEPNASPSFVIYEK